MILLNIFYMRCHRYFALIYHLKLVYLHKPKFLSCYTLRYHRCYAPRYRVYKANLHNFRLTQLLYGSVTLARCAALPCRFSLPPTTSRGFLSHSPMATYNTLWQCTDLTIGLRRRWCVGPMRRIDLITFRSPYLLPHCGFPFTASQFGKSYVRKKVMCGPHTSLHSSVASHPTLPSSVWHGHVDRYNLYNLGWRRL